tara:strand:- start:306 stop:584 length:279 start_codon:yes stop_codon:yes gene_type:complete
MSNIKDLNIAQQGELIESFVDSVVDSMDLESLVDYVKQDLYNHYQSLSYPELEEEIKCTFDDETFDELVSNSKELIYTDEQKRLTTLEELGA